MIKLDQVTKYYGRFMALDHIDFEVKAGEIIAFLGPNGAGKTTTMRILTGFLTPTEGNVMIDGVDIFEEPENVKGQIGYLPENPPLYPELTVTEYLTFVAELKKVPAENIKKQVDKVIELADLGQRKNTMIGFLSKGLKQRVGIAQSIVNAPKVLVLDEPTVGLDPVQVIEIRNLINNLAHEEKRTIILSTHILSEASEICGRAIIINNGRILAMDTIENLKKEYLNDIVIRVKVARVSDRLQDALQSIHGVRSVAVQNNELTVRSGDDIREDLARMIVDSGAGLLEMTRGGNTLEDVFVKLVM